MRVKHENENLERGGAYKYLSTHTMAPYEHTRSGVRRRMSNDDGPSSPPGYNDVDEDKNMHLKVNVDRLTAELTAANAHARNLETQLDLARSRVQELDGRSLRKPGEKLLGSVLLGRIRHLETELTMANDRVAAAEAAAATAEAAACGAGGDALTPELEQKLEEWGMSCDTDEYTDLSVMIEAFMRLHGPTTRR